jgi:DNA-binding transcriptional LysR family regulator
MELRHLEAVAAVAEHGSFSAAADAIHTVQSNVSSLVARLERELGATLVDRSMSRLTPEGEVVVARARRVLDEIAALKADLAGLKNEVSGTVRLGMIGTTARWLVPALLAVVSARHPKLRLIVTEGTTTGLEPHVASGRLDAAVLSFPIPGRDLVIEELFEEDLVLVVPTDHDPLDGRHAVEIGELERFDLLLPPQGTPFRAEIDALARPRGVRLRARAELDGVRLIASLTFEGFGPAILPATAVPRHLRDRFRHVAILGMPPRRVGLVQRSRGLPSAATRALLELIREQFRSPRNLPEGVRPVRPRRPELAEGAPRGIGPPEG